MTDERAWLLFLAEFGNIDCPSFQSAGQIHDWRNYVGDELEAIWSTFTPVQKLAIARNAQRLADAEDWD